MTSTKVEALIGNLFDLLVEEKQTSTVAKMSSAEWIQLAAIILPMLMELIKLMQSQKGAK